MHHPPGTNYAAFHSPEYFVAMEISSVWETPMPPAPLTALFVKNRGNTKSANRFKCLIDSYFTCSNLLIRVSKGVKHISPREQMKVLLCPASFQLRRKCEPDK